MGVPQITFTFQKAADEVVSRLKNGIVGVIVRDGSASAGLYTVAAEADLPANLSATNRAYVLQALSGSRDNKPTKALVAVMATDGNIVANGAAQFAATDIDYLAGPPDMTAAETTQIKTWLDTARSGYFIGKFVAADYAADNMAVINFCANGIIAGTVEYEAKEYCARIAGILASTSLAASATYAPLDEVTAVTAVENPDSAVDSGKLILLHDGRKAKIARAVNSLVTVPAGQSSELKKIKVVEAVDLIRHYAIALIEDTYVGQKANSYDDKMNLVADLVLFLRSLESQDVLEADSGDADIDVDTQREWLKNHGVDVTNLDDNAIRKENTGSRVFIVLRGRILDAMEDFSVLLQMGGNA